MLPSEQTLRETPYQTYPLGDETVVWWDEDLSAFLVGPEEPDGADEATEYATYAELAAAV